MTDVSPAVDCSDRRHLDVSNVLCTEVVYLPNYKQHYIYVKGP